MFTIAYVPRLWRRIMDLRLLQAVSGDVSRINFDPAKREVLMKRHALHEAPCLKVGEVKPPTTREVASRAATIARLFSTAKTRILR